MQSKEWNFIDKSKWPKGVWNEEPDKAQWVDEKTGMPCLIRRVEHSGHLCGYVGVGKSHPLYKVSYDDTDIDVHGGLTYSELCWDGDKEHGICLIVEEGEEEPLWWFGFDCAHSGDLSPAYGHYGVYKSFNYVKSECTRLAGQLKLKGE